MNVTKSFTVRVIGIFLCILSLSCTENKGPSELYATWASPYASTGGKVLLPELTEAYVNDEIYRDLMGHPGARAFIRDRLNQYVGDSNHRRQYPYDIKLMYGYSKLVGIPINVSSREAEFAELVSLLNKADKVSPPPSPR